MTNEQQPTSPLAGGDDATPVMSIAPGALEKILEIREQEPGDEEFALFIEITGVQGTQFAYELSFVPVVDARPGDHLEYHGDLPVVIPGRDVPNLRGASLDLTDAGLAMRNPNQPMQAPSAIPEDLGDLDTTSEVAVQVAQVLERQINPSIAMHGGAAELVGMREGTVFVRLLGGCQGCGLASVTLSQGIERMLREAVPEVMAVVDVTDHASGTDPYYQPSKK